MIIALGILPVFFLPFTQDYYDTNKWILLAGTSLFLFFLWGLQAALTGSLPWNKSALVKSLGILVLASLVSLVFSPNKTESILTPFGLGTFLSLFLLASVGSAFLDEKARIILRWALMTTVSLSGLLAIYQFFGLGKILFPWTPVGTDVGLMTVLLITLPVLIRETFHRKHAGHDTHMIVALVMSIACGGGLILTAYQVLGKWGTTTLPFWVNWEILLENYKNLKQLMVGVGAQNFLGAFTAGRPATINMTGLWNTRFVVGSSMLFHMATVQGLVGLVGVVWFLTRLRNPILLLGALSLVFLPPSFPALVVIVTILMLIEPVHIVHTKLPHKKIIRYAVVLILFLIFATTIYGFGRAASAEFAFGKSLAAFDKREGTNAYNLQIQAITLNPNVARFHMAYAQTNLALANAISGSASISATKEQLDKDRQTTTQLIQQAIREAKIAIGLAPTNILAWENIASVYQTLAGVAQGADQWTIAAYQQAMQLDPTNPTIRLRLGGAYVGQQKFDEAIASYNAAASLKPDYANVYYNMGFAYREQKKYLQASQALLEALKYVTPGSADEGQAKKELNEVTELLTETEKQSLNEPAAATPTPKSAPLSPLP